MLHHTTQHDTNYNYSYNYNYATLHYTTLRYPTLHYTALITPPHMQLQLHYSNSTTPQLQLHNATTTAALRHTTSSSCGWGDRPGDHCNHFNHSKNRQLQPPFSPSVDSLCRPWFATTKLSYRFPILKLSPPPCAVLLVLKITTHLFAIEVSIKYLRAMFKTRQNMPKQDICEPLTLSYILSLVMPSRLLASSKVPNSRNHGSWCRIVRFSSLHPPKKSKVKIHIILIVSYLMAKRVQSVPPRCASGGLGGIQVTMGFNTLTKNASLRCLAWPWKPNSGNVTSG